MPISGGTRAALFAALTGACSAQPDVVATQRAPAQVTDASSPFLTVPLVSECQAGTYHGDFSISTSQDASAQPFSLYGTFGFTLVQTMSVEFLTLSDNSTLDGTAAAGVLTFHAALESGTPCREGFITTSIEQGTFTVTGGNAPQGFHGTVWGSYVPGSGFAGFVGGLTVTVDNTPPLYLSGNWSAAHDP